MKPHLLLTLISLAVMPLMRATEPWAGSGTVDDPYQIGSTADWDNLAANVNAGNRYSGIFFVQTQDIAITTMIGEQGNPFCGHYDGDHKTLDIDFNYSSVMEVAPFRYAHDASFRDIIETGTLWSDDYHAGSLVGLATGNISIINCRFGVSYTNPRHDINSGGVVGFAQNGCSLTMEGCLNIGRFTANPSSNGFGGMVYAETGATVRFINCLFKPSEIIGFFHLYNNTYLAGGVAFDENTFTNCYYTEPIGFEGGKHAYRITGAKDIPDKEDITVERFEFCTVGYDVSGILAYETGLELMDGIYAAEGEEIQLNLSGANTFKASAGTLTGDMNPHTLLVGNANTIIESDDEDTPTGYVETAADTQAIKFLRDGMLYLTRNGHVYRATGEQIQ